MRCRYGDRYGLWANDMGDDNIDIVISHIDMGYLVTLWHTPRHAAARHGRAAELGKRDAHVPGTLSPKSEHSGNESYGYTGIQ